MTDIPDSTELHHLAEQVVRLVAAGTGLTTIATVGVGADGIAVATKTGFSPHNLDSSYERLLDTAARLERRHPGGVPAYACALILPEHDVAYLHHHETGTGLAQVLTVGRNPVDDPYTRQSVQAGLEALMQAIGDTQPATRPIGRAFPPMTPGRMPNTSPRYGPAGGWSPPSSGPDRRGHHR